MTDINLLGRTLGPFQIISELGRGGMAVVYKARQIDLERMVALKILPPELSLDKSYLARFLQEARSAAALEHPHIVPIYQIGAADGINYIAMKYIAGKTLKDVVQQHGALKLDQVALVLDQVADALDYAHSQGVIHRDIKPSNMMAEQNGWVYLTDFGLARGGTTGGLTMTGTVMGTPEYMSPEQAQGLSTIGPPTDIYALGVVLYELLTGQMPFQADTPMGMLVARLQYAPRPPRDYRNDLPMPVEDVIMRALARKPEARYATAKEMIVALKSAAGLGTRPLSVPQRPVSPVQGIPAAPTIADSPPLSQPTYTAGTPPYVIPAATGPTVTAARTATPPPMPATSFDSPSLPRSNTTEKPRVSRTMLVGGIAALLLVLALAAGAFVLTRPRGPDPRIAEGNQAGRQALGEKGGIAKAIDSYQQVLKIDPNNVTAHTQLALIYDLRGQDKAAADEARKAITADPKAAFAQAILAESLNNQGEYKDALDTIKQAIKLDDKLSFSYGVLSGIEANQAIESSDADMLKQAATDADKSIELAAKDDNLIQSLAHSARGYVYWQQYSLSDDSSMVDAGVEEYNRAIGLQGQLALFHSNLGYFYNAQEKYDLAQKKFEAALDADDQYGHSHTGLGWNLYYLKDYKGALGEFDKALGLNGDDTDAFMGKSYVYQDQDKPDFDMAIDELNQAAAISPKSLSVRSNIGWANRRKARSFKFKSDEQKAAYAEAEKQFRQALQLNDRYVSSLTGLGWTLRDQAATGQGDDKYNQAIDTFKQSLDIKESQDSAYNGMGWCYYDLKQYDDAVQAFSRATELSPDYGDAYYGLGLSYEAQGKKDDARAAYQKAQDHGSPYAEEALNRLK